MDDHYITVGEFALLVFVFVGPALLGAGSAQFVLLRQAGLRISPALMVLVLAAVVTLLLTWALLYAMAPAIGDGYVTVFLLPALIAATAVTLCIRFYARRWHSTA